MRRIWEKAQASAGTQGGVVAEFNAKYAVVNEAGKAMVYERVRDPVLDRYVLVRITFEDFKKLHLNRFIASEGDRPKNAATAWLASPSRRQYLSGVIFDPTGRAPDTYWNLWTGFSVTPAPGEWGLMRGHLRDVICGGDERSFRYVMDWTAMMFQAPHVRAGVALVFQGLKGVGKGIWFNTLVKAFGQHGLYISNAKHLVGNFNDHLRDCVMLFADEAFFAGDRAHEGILKSLITDPYLAIEGKYKSVITAPNMLHIAMASNSDWGVPASTDERRYFVLNVSDSRRGDLAYFRAIMAEMEDGGLAAMIYEMLHRDISNFKVNDIPESEALDEQKELSLDSLDRWLLTVLERGYVWRSRFGERFFGYWFDFYTTDLLEASYRQWCGDNREARPKTRVQLGKRLATIYAPHRPNEGGQVLGEVEVCPKDCDPVRRAPPDQRSRGYQMGTLNAARLAFSRVREVKRDWEDDSAEIPI